MSLANTLLNGGTYGVSVEASKYSHSNGATRIAMESVAELHDIFMESFYNTNQAELAAATEGVALEGSQYEAVYEAAINNGIAKVKEFLKNLWAKVKAFFHNVKRYLDAIFMSGVEFAKKYAQDIRSAGTLKDFEYNMYDYDNALIDDTAGTDIGTDDIVDDIISGFGGLEKSMLKIADGMDDSKKEGMSKTNEMIADKMDELRKKFDRDEVAKRVVSAITGGKCKDPDDIDEFLFKVYRKGNTDKEDIEVKNLVDYANILTESSKLASTVDKFGKKVDSAYSKALKQVNDAETKWAKYSSKVSGNAAEIMRLMSTAISVGQTYNNKLITSWKTVVKERDTAYKSLIVSGLSYANKQKKQSK